MASSSKLVLVLAVVVAAVTIINLLAEILSGLIGFQVTPFISTINMALAGFAAGIGFYFAKSFAEK